MMSGPLDSISGSPMFVVSCNGWTARVAPVPLAIGLGEEREIILSQCVFPLLNVTAKNTGQRKAERQVSGGPAQGAPRVEPAAWGNPSAITRSPSAPRRRAGGLCT